MVAKRSLSPPIGEAVTTTSDTDLLASAVAALADPANRALMPTAAISQDFRTIRLPLSARSPARLIGCYEITLRPVKTNVIK